MYVWPTNYWPDSVSMSEETGIPEENPQSQATYKTDSSSERRD